MPELYLDGRAHEAEYHPWDGQMPNNALGVGSQAHIFNPSLYDRSARQEQSSAVEWDMNFGVPVASSLQNMYILVARDALQTAQLVPTWGEYMDSYDDVYRNVLTGPALPS